MDIKIINSKKIALRRKVGHLEMKKKLDPQDPNYVKDNSRGFQMEKKLVSSKKLASARKVGHLKKSYIKISPKENSRASKSDKKLPLKM